MARLDIDGRDRWSVRCCLGVERVDAVREGEAMSQQSMRKAVRPWRQTRTRCERRGADWVSRAVPIEVQDHHGVDGYAERNWSHIGCPQVRAAIAEFRSFRTIQMYR